MIKPSTSNLQINATPNTQIAIPSVSNLQMTPYFINDNFIDNFDSSQYVMAHDNIFQQDTRNVLVSIKFNDGL